MICFQIIFSQHIEVLIWNDLPLSISHLNESEEIFKYVIDKRGTYGDVNDIPELKKIADHLVYGKRY